MTFRVGRALVITEGDFGDCDLCGAHDELRPYGPNGENICFDCGMAQMEVTKAKFAELVGDATVALVDLGVVEGAGHDDIN